MSHPHVYRPLARAAAALALLGAACAPALALTTYTYTAPITYWANSWGAANWASYAALDGSGISFEFTTTAPLTSVGCLGVNCDSVDTLAQVTSWRYHGGSSFLNLSSSTVGTLSGLFLSTDATGAIINNGTDRFYVNGPVTITGLEAYHSTLSEAHSIYDQQVMASDYMRQYSTGIYSNPLYASLSEGMSNNRGAGSWSWVTSAAPIVSAVPEPESWMLMLVGLGAVGTLARRSARARQA